MASEQAPQRDNEGYLIDLNDWTEAVAHDLAKEEQLDLTSEHLEIVRAIRKFYSEFGISPSVRALVKYLGNEMGTHTANSAYLMQHFGGSPLKPLCKIAGLPKPTNCL